MPDCTWQAKTTSVRPRAWRNFTSWGKEKEIMNGKTRTLSQDDQFILLRVTGPINHFISSAGIVIKGKNPSFVLCLWVSVVLTSCVRTSSTLSMRETVTTSGKKNNFQGSLMFSLMDPCNTKISCETHKWGLTFCSQEALQWVRKNVG